MKLMNLKLDCFTLIGEKLILRAFYSLETSNKNKAKENEFVDETSAILRRYFPWTDKNVKPITLWFKSKKAQFNHLK